MGYAMSEKKALSRPTSRDVARLAGVSQTTVSFVLNEAANVSISEETRTRVRQAVVQLDYHPHDGARSLSRRASRAIGLAIPDADNPHYREIAAGVEQYAESKGYTMVLAITNFDIRRERQALAWLKQQRCDALIISSVHWAALREELRLLHRQGYPVTTLGLRDAPLDSVGPPSAVGERLIVEHLAALGHRHIGYIYGVFSQAAFHQRLAACLAAQRACGLPVVEAWVRRCGPTIENGYRETRALLDACAGAQRPTALIVVNDHLALGVLAALHQAGIAVPEEISVASFDNTPLAPYLIPSLTSVDHDARGMGQQAARLSIDRLTLLNGPPLHLDTSARLVARGSTGPAPPALHAWGEKEAPA